MTARVEVTKERTLHGGQWVEYSIHIGCIPNVGHIFLPEKISRELVNDIFADIVNSEEEVEEVL